MSSHIGAVSLGLFSVAAINSIYNTIAQVVGRAKMDPIIFSTYRDLAATPVLFCAAVVAKDQVLMPRSREDGIRLAVQGGLGIFANQLLFLVGVGLTSSTVGAICNLTVPIFSAVVGSALGLEEPSLRTAVGLALVVVGACVMKMQGTGAVIDGHGWTGIVLLLIGAFASAVYYWIQKKTLAKYTTAFVVAWEYAFGFAFMAVAATFKLFLYDKSFDPSMFALQGKTAYAALAFSVVFNSILKYWLNASCNRAVSATVLTAWSTLTLPLTAALSVLLLDGEVTRAEIFGCIPILIGIAIVSSRRPKDAAVEESAWDRPYRMLTGASADVDEGL